MDRQSGRSAFSLKPGDGVPGAMMVRGLKDTSSRPAKDLGGEPCGARVKRRCGVMTALSRREVLYRYLSFVYAANV